MNLVPELTYLKCHMLFIGNCINVVCVKYFNKARGLYIGSCHHKGHSLLFGAYQQNSLSWNVFACT